VMSELSEVNDLCVVGCLAPVRKVSGLMLLHLIPDACVFVFSVWHVGTLGVQWMYWLLDWGLKSGCGV
jgi:hypothetical protein